MIFDESVSPQMISKNEKIPNGVDLFRLLRNTQIFASVVRESLGQDLLDEVSPGPLSASQFHLIRLMLLYGCRSVREAARFLGVSAPAASKSVEKLVKLGLVHRERSLGDRRAMRLSVSDSGRRLVQDYERLKAERLAEVLAAIRPEEVGKLSDLLERFSVSIMERNRVDEKSCHFCGAYITEGCPTGEFRGGCPYLRDGHAERVEAR